MDGEERDSLKERAGSPAARNELRPDCAHDGFGGTDCAPVPGLVHEQAPLAVSDGSGSSIALAREYISREQVLWPRNRCSLLRDGVEAFPSMLDAIRGARRFIRLETYMFYDDAVGRLFARALGDAAERGVDVTVLYDALGSRPSRRRFFEQMRVRGVDVRACNPFSFRQLSRWIKRDHRKLLIVDGEVAFVGGINISAHWAPLGHEGGQGWRDDVLRVEGPAVHQLERCFKATWRMQVRKRLQRFREILRQRRARHEPAPGGTLLAVLSSRRSIHHAYVHAIRRARSSVLVAAAYFVPERRLVQALRDAAQRGVQVRLILNGRSDHRWLHFATQAFYDRLLTAGIAIYEWCHGNLHAKTAVVDGMWGTVGSFNLERTSLWLNYEVNVAFADPTLGRALERSFEQDAAMCTRIDLASWRKRPLWRKVLERVLWAFRKVL